MYMLENYPTSHFTHFRNSYLDTENQNPCSNQYHSSMNYSCITNLVNYVSPLQTSKLNNHHGGLFDSISYKHQEEEQTLTGDQLRSLTNSKQSIDKKQDIIKNQFIEKEKDQDDSLIDLSRKLRTNLSLVKQRMMNGLKTSSKPKDIAIYTKLEKTSPLNKSSRRRPGTIHTINNNKTVGNGRNLFFNHPLHRKYHIQKKKPYSRGSSYMELQCNDNGFVSVVLRNDNHKGESTSTHPYATLSRSFSFDVTEEGDADDLLKEMDSNDSDDSDDSDTSDKVSQEIMLMNNSYATNRTNTNKPAIQQLDAAMSSSTSSPETMIQDIWSPTSTIDVYSNSWLSNANLFGQDHNNHYYDGDLYYHQHDMNRCDQINENDIDLWLQRGGFGGVPLVVATDQELADLLDFDMITNC
ncbi:unnamed protein product [Cunninghamella blakesleeana]